MSEFDDKYSGRYFGKRRARVVRVDDPRKLGRVMLRIPDLFGKEEIGWALPVASDSCGNHTGQYSPPKIGDKVWAEFEEGDPSRPLWGGGYWTEVNGKSTVMEHAQGLPHGTDYSIRDHGNIPPSSFAGVYSNVKVIQGKDGGFLEFDSTPGAQRVQLVHKSGSRLEFTSDGSVNEVVTGAFRGRVEGDDWKELAGNKIETVAGNSEFTHGGSVSRTVSGPTKEKFGSFSREGGVLREKWDDIEVASVGKMKVNSGGNLGLSSGGQVNLMAGQNFVGTVLETFELMVSGATTGQMPPGMGGPDAVVSLIQAFNGINCIKATDLTGALMSSSFEANPMCKLAGMLPMASMVAKSPAGEGRIDVVGLPGGLGSVHLGGFPAMEYLVKGTSFSVSLMTLTAGLLAFSTAVMGDPMLKVLAPATSAGAVALTPIVTAFLAAIPSFLSLKVATQ